MKKLTVNQFERASAFLRECGRALDQSLFAFYFEDGSEQGVLAELAAYQNDDGGFGRALEPDVRLDDSSVLATTTALQVLRKVDAPASHPLVREAIGYLLRELDPNALAWTLVPSNVDDAPHAPWWAPGEKPTRFTANPGAEIVGHYHHWASLVPADLLAQLTDAAMQCLRGMAEAQMHDMLCYEALRRTEAVPAALRAELLNLARPFVADIVVGDPSVWNGYCARPLQFASSPDSAYLEIWREAVEINLDYLIDTQASDGAWPPHWSWGPEGGADWEQAKRDWQGVIIVDHLCSLRAFGRLER